MHSCRLPLDAEILRSMYVDKGLTTEEMATRLGCGVSTVGRRLHEFGIETRPRGPDPGGPRLLDSVPRWSAETAGLVGVIATDGNLANTGRTMSISSMDVQLLETALAVPDEYFADFLRGCIDGDGTVLVYTDRYHAAKKASDVYRRLYVSLVSASHPFITWLRETIRRLRHLRGAVQARHKPERQPVWVLRYSKKESIHLLRWMYHSPDVPCLLRKRVKAEPFLLEP